LPAQIRSRNFLVIRFEVGKRSEERSENEIASTFGIPVTVMMMREPYRYLPRHPMFCGRTSETCRHGIRSRTESP
jgi:hypothetical protein